MRRFRVMHDEGGAVLVIVAVALVVLIGMAALSIDLGQMYVARQRAQNICDAAALAGGNLLTGRPDCAKSTGFPAAAALNCIDANNAAVEAWRLQGFDITFPTQVEYDNSPGQPVSVKKGEAIRVTGSVNVEFGFAGIFGFDSKLVSASATVVLTPAMKRITCQPDIPIGLPVDWADGLQFGDTPVFGTVGDWQEAPVGPGNWLSLQFADDEEGMPDYIERLRGEGETVEISAGDQLETQTGGATGESMASKTYEGLVGRNGDGRLNLETNPDYVPTDISTGYNPTAWDTWKASQDPVTGLYDTTKRIVILPVIEGTSSGASDLVTVVGFAAFFIEMVYDDSTLDPDGVLRPKGDIQGYFIQAIMGENPDETGWVFPVEGTWIEDPGGVRKPRLIS